VSTTVPFEIVVLVVVVALGFDFMNGFHDAANSVATVVSTRVLSPRIAVLWAAFFNFVAAFVFGVKVGGLIGAGVVKGGWGVVQVAGVSKIAYFIVLSPVIGFFLAIGLVLLTVRIAMRYSRSTSDHAFRRLQLVSAALYSLGHGTNDAQKTMGIIAALLFAQGLLGSTFYVPFYVILLAGTAMGFGTYFGGWRIVRTMGMKITKLHPFGGFSAETAAASTLFATASLGIPVSTTHTIAGAIMGVGSTRRLSAVRWGVARRIVYAWVLTIPAAAAIAGLSYYILKLVGLS
jgi:PiT family inorganic phosphate transporter